MFFQFMLNGVTGKRILFLGAISALATFHRKNAISEGRPHDPKLNGVASEFSFYFSSLELSMNLLGSSQCKIASHLNQIVGDYPEPYPSLHALEPAIQTAAQPVPSFECADAAF